nr:MAG TPA: hypothetical protein [Caudoviricetes sp.]
MPGDAESARYRGPYTRELASVQAIDRKMTVGHR